MITEEAFAEMLKAMSDEQFDAFQSIMRLEKYRRYAKTIIKCVVCVHKYGPFGRADALTTGKVYDVVGNSYDNSEEYVIIDDIGSRRSYHKSRFDDVRKIK